MEFPSSLVRLLETMSKLSEKLNFCDTLKSYFMKRYQEIMINFNITLSKLIIEKFRLELPMLFVPVVKLIIES